MPKSVMTTLPSRAQSTLSGLRSRCTTPTACAAESPRHSSAPTSSTRWIDSRPAVAIAEASDSPSTYSIVKNFPRGESPISNTRATLRCVMRLASFTSRLNRSSMAALPTSSGFRIFSATSSSSSRSNARYTVPMPPSPSGARSSYRPASSTGPWGAAAVGGGGCVGDRVMRGLRAGAPRRRLCGSARPASTASRRRLRPRCSACLLG
jgi:hypothetical protein